MPGPNVVNLSLMIGGRYFGLPGALAALTGMLAAPLVIVLLLAALYGSVADTAAAQGALKGMGAVAAGLITATGIKLIAALEKKRHGTVGLHRPGRHHLRRNRPAALPLAWVLLVVGGGACLWAYRVLGVQDRDTKA